MSPTEWSGDAPLISPEPWVADALCAQVDAEIFFPPKGGSTDAAKRVCAACDVTAECLAYALRTGQDDGIWGGLSRMERRELSRGAAA